MQPNNPQNQPDVSANLPPVQGVALNQPSLPAGANDMNQALPTADAAIHYAMKAKQLVLQYGNDPYKLAAALGQLKTAYFAEQYHITSNPTGN
jgi:hypothetical protein